jgi:hypothetical protein
MTAENKRAEVQKQPAVAPPNPKVQAETKGLVQSIRERTGLWLQAGGTVLGLAAAIIEGAELANPIGLTITGIGLTFAGVIEQIWE